MTKAKIAGAKSTHQTPCEILPIWFRFEYEVSSILSHGSHCIRHLCNYSPPENQSKNWSIAKDSSPSILPTRKTSSYPGYSSGATKYGQPCPLMRNIRQRSTGVFGCHRSSEIFPSSSIGTGQRDLGMRSNWLSSGK